MSKDQAETWANVDVNEFHRRLIVEFRSNNGKLSGMFEGRTLAVLTTVGAKSGLRRESILAYLEFDGKGIVVASANGADKHPGWYHNIRKNPIVTVETGTDTYQAIAAIPPGQERDKLFDRVIAEAPGYADYQANTTREIPVVVLHRIPKPGEERATGLGDWIVTVHDWLRTELQKLRAQADQAIEGGAGPIEGGAGPIEGGAGPIEPTPPDLAQQLRAHCLNFCGTLTKHHVGEDMGMFPMLAKHFPALAPALTRLGEEHKTVARLLEDIQRLVDEFDSGESDLGQLRADLERLANELEAHFRYEEETLVTALNATMTAPDFG